MTRRMVKMRSNGDARFRLLAMYRESFPSEALRPWIAAYWDSRRTGANRVLPDGCADIIFDLDRGEAFVVGTMTRPMIVEPGERSNLRGIRFRPGRLAALLRMPLSEVTDSLVPLRDVNRRLELRVDSIEGDLRCLVTEGDRRVDAAVQWIERRGGTADVQKVADSIGVTRQHLARLFAHHVGVSPKTFARIVRFRCALRFGRKRPWADVAAHLGYTDQSHLIAEFREFSGTTPVPFFLSKGGGES